MSQTLRVFAAHQLEIELVHQQVKVKGSLYLLNKIRDLRSQFGDDPQNWQIGLISCKEDILVNEFIEKVKGSYQLCYKHEELCHCRMIPTETVVQAIKQGCQTTADISRSTKAGTGCGTCVINSQMLLNQLLKK